MAEIRIEDLWSHCAKCNGTGRIVERSGGFGVSSVMEQNCPDCRGKGGKITDSGNAVLKFLKEMKRSGDITF